MRSLRSLPRSDCQRDGVVSAELIAPETYRRLMESPSQRCNGIVTTKWPPPDASESASGGGLCAYVSELLCCFPDRPPAGRDALQAGLDPGAQLLRQRRVTDLRRLGL